MHLTVGIPVFNAMPYLQESLQSILRQSYRDFSILVINDGSTDDSLACLRSIRDPRVRIVTQNNQGLTATLNRMLVEVKTPWLIRFDADDVARPERLSLIAEYIERFPQSGMFYSRAEYYPQRSVGLFRSTNGTPEEIHDLVQSGYLPSICHPTVTLNVAKVMSLGGYRFNLHVEDIDLWWRMALNYQIRMIPEVTVGFRQNLDSVSSKNLASQALNTLYVQYLLISHLHNQDTLAYEEVKEQLSLFVKRRHLSFKVHSRQANIDLGKGKICSGLYQAARAVVASPRDLFDRFLDEIRPNRSICLGAPVSMFMQHQQKLWPPAGPPMTEMADASIPVPNSAALPGRSL